MIRKRKSALTTIAGFALAMVFCLSTALPALATDDDPKEAYPATEAAITKILDVPIGTEVPDNMQFTFEVSRVSEDGATPTDAMPVVGDNGFITIKFDGTQKTIGTTGDVTSYFRESDDIFKDKTWTHAGVYEYKIIEREDKSYAANANPPPTEKLSYSKAEYTVYVYVDKVNGDFKITHIGVLMTKDDSENSIPDDEQVKVDPTPGGDGEEGSYSDMTFVNRYVKTNGGTDTEEDPKDPEKWTLAISKKVSGPMANTDKEFDFELIVTAPSLADNKSFAAYIVELDADSGTYSIKDSSLSFASGIRGDFQLKHNQFLVFIDTPVGTSYEVFEKGTADYTPQAVVTYDTTQKWHAYGSKGQGLRLPDDLSGNVASLFVGEGANSADFENIRGQTTPTGISLDNLPFIVLIAIGAMAFVGYAVFKIRKNKVTAR